MNEAETLNHESEEIQFAETEIGAEIETGDEIPKESRTLRTQAYDKSVSDLIAMMDGDIRLDPHYQRSYIWDNKRASLLVESILLNVPIPVIYVEEDEESVWNVVDGLQRLNSLKRFFANEFKLTGLEVLPELNRLQYSTLPAKAQRILRNGIIRIIVILQESHHEIKYDIFLRLNRGAVKLNEQELRNCLYRGTLNDALKKMRQDTTFQKILGLKAPHARFMDAELVLRGLALMHQFDSDKKILRNYSGKMKSFLNTFINQNKNIGEKEIKRFEKLFYNSVACSYAVFGNKAFRRLDIATGRPENLINRAIFDIMVVGFCKYEPQQITPKKEEIIEALLQLQRSDSEFNEAITFATGDTGRVEYRLSKWTDAINSIMQLR
ncbi:DUF262 domain-containing protein [Azohydromonas aeria]|uniref:DUF262 domain-containing protein n=1 Tax=Azohydromonas aeria TaxID=2590212 RepID=UPI0012F9DC9B|nr:DUF262 domain-containing protein [Azohydromonas aeria]